MQPKAGHGTVPAMIRRSTFVLLWLLAVALFSAAATAWQWRAALAENESAGLVAHRIISQRADQHDAHMTSLSSLALTASPPPGEALILVARSIMQFYPRITAMDLVPLEQGPAPISTRADPGDALADRIREAALPVTTKPALIRVDGVEGRYLLIKRVPNTASAIAALALEIDPRRLADLEGTALASYRPELAMPDGSALAASAVTEARSGPVSFERALGSVSQPLVLRLRQATPLASVVPWGGIAAFSVLAALAAWAMSSFAGARLAEREARRHAAFREQEVRLAHASRINAMGELSLGIAHELTQPLAAILSQSQAGLRLAQAQPMDTVAVAKVLEANVRHARRAGDILARLRSWVSAKPGEVKPINLNRVAADVVALTRADLERRGVMAMLDLATPAPEVTADPVEFEQIVYNLVTNAADACGAMGRGKVRIRTFAAADRVGLEVRDNGPGLTPDVLARVFEPFYTSKADGMGLGLALCQRLVEKIGGQITAANHPEGGAVFAVLLPPARVVTPSDRLAAE